MNLTQIKYFITAAKYMNFTKAAEALYITQPTISKQIDALEEELGFKLFDRTSKKMKLTLGGELILEEFQKTVEAFEKALHVAKQIKSGSRGHLDIGYPSSLNITTLLPGLFKKFSEQYPKVTIELFTYDFKDLRTKLLNDDLDLILTVSFDKICKNSECLENLAIHRSSPRIYFNKQLVDTIDSVSIENFKKMPLISLDNDNDISMSLSLKYGLNTSKIITANSLETMFFYIESGEGIAILGSSYQITKNPSVSYLEFGEQNDQVGTDLFWKSDIRNPSVEVFIEFLKNYLSY